MGTRKVKWESTVELTVAHHCDCVCGEDGLREYSVAVRPSNASNAAAVSALHLDEHELVGLVGAVARHFSSGMEDSAALFGPWGKVGSQINQRTFQLRRNEAAELGAFDLQVTGGTFHDILPLDEPHLLKFMLLVVGLKFKETGYKGCLRGDLFHPLKKFPYGWLTLQLKDDC
jgi:hypothetical protein